MRSISSSKNPKQSGIPLYEQAVRLLILVLAQTGFYYCFITEYGLVAPVSAFLFTLAVCLLYIAVFSLKSRAVLFALSIALSGVFVWFHADQIVQSWLLLLRDLISACGGALPDYLKQILKEEGNSILYALCSVMFFSSILSSFAVTKGDSVFLLILSSVPALLPGLFFSLAGNTAAFFAILASWLAFYIFRRYDGLLSAAASEDTDLRLKVRPDRIRRRTALRSLSAVAAVLMAFSAFGISSVILPEKGYEKPDIWNDLRNAVYNSKLGDLIGRPNDGLSHGKFRDLSEIRFTGDTALKARVSEKISLYVRNYAGTVYTNDGWEEVPERDYVSYVIGTNPLLMHAEADRMLGNDENRFLFSVKSDRTIESLLLPQGLLTGAEELNGTAYRNDTGIDNTGGSAVTGYSVYALQLRNAFATVPVSRSSEPADAVREGYESVVRSKYGRSAISDDISHYLRYVFDYYAKLPEDTERYGKALCEQFGISADLKSGTLNIAEICSSLQRMFNSYCSYSYDPPVIPADRDFATYFMNESRQGYCIHFATTAAVMLRSLGIPARYAEGYIIVQNDYMKDTDDEGYFTVEDTHAHAWVEVFDPLQLEWIPVEMTPNEGDESSADGLAPTLSPPPTATPLPTGTEDPADMDAEESTPEPEMTDEPEQAEEQDDQPDPEEDAVPDDDLEQDPDSGEGREELPSEERGDVEQNSGNGGDIPDLTASLSDGTGNGGGSSNGGNVLRILIGIMIPLLIAASVVSLYMFNRKRRREKLYGNASESVLFIAKECDAMIRLSGGSSIRQEEMPGDYAVRIISETPKITEQDIFSVFKTAQEAMYSNRMISEKDRNTVLKAQEHIRKAAVDCVNPLKKLWIMLRYPSETSKER